MSKHKYCIGHFDWLDGDTPISSREKSGLFNEVLQYDLSIESCAMCFVFINPTELLISRSISRNTFSFTAICEI